MYATVLPRKQLEYVLKKQGYKEDKNMEWHKRTKPYGYCSRRLLKFCLKEIGICRLSDFGDNDYAFQWFTDIEELKGLNWDKEWFIPSSFRERN